MLRPAMKLPLPVPLTLNMVSAIATFSTPFIAPDPGKLIGEMLSYNYHLSQQNIPLNITEMINKSIETVAQDIPIYLEGQPKFSTALRKNERAVFEQLFVAGSRYSIYTDNRVSYSESANV